ncbi:MAG: cytochrome c, partial [Acidobacteria bacterium]|nr:cytochrome c [Acidobacteriota bacterium]
MKPIRITLIALSLLVIAFYALRATQASGAKRLPKNITFSKEVAPIFNAKCAECHRPGEAAPFSVLSYKDVRPWAKSIREHVVNRTMPPWHADPHFGNFKNERRLSQAEIDTITAWVEGGAVEGNAKDLPPVPTFVEGWNIGQPDIVFTLPQPYTVEATGPDEYQYFNVPTNFTEDKYVHAIEARPGNRK